MSPHVRIALAHDYLTQHGGAERVALEFVRMYPGVPLYTTVYNPNGTFAGFDQADVRASWLSKIPSARRDPRPFLPVLPLAVSSLLVDDVDVLLCSSSGWSHAVRAPGARKIIYCHNPARWLHQSSDYIGGNAFQRMALSALRGSLTRFDARAAFSAHRYVANSRNVADRIWQTYGIRADVVHPPRGLEPHGEEEPVQGLQPGFLLTVGRPRGYKNTEALVGVMSTRPLERLVWVGGDAAMQNVNITALTGVSDAQLRWLYKNCRALVGLSFEDFGLTPVEAMAHGKPVVLLRAGGYLETNREGLSGVFVDRLERSAILGALDELDGHAWDSEAIQSHASNWSPQSFRNRMAQIVDDVAHDC